MIKHSEKSENIYLTFRDTVDQGAVFLGGYALDFFTLNMILKIKMLLHEKFLI